MKRSKKLWKETTNTQIFLKMFISLLATFSTIAAALGDRSPYVELKTASGVERVFRERKQQKLRFVPWKQTLEASSVWSRSGPCRSEMLTWLRLRDQRGLLSNMTALGLGIKGLMIKGGVRPTFRLFCQSSLTSHTHTHTLIRRTTNTPHPQPQWRFIHAVSWEIKFIFGLNHNASKSGN